MKSNVLDEKNKQCFNDTFLFLVNMRPLFIEVIVVADSLECSLGGIVFFDLFVRLFLCRLFEDCDEFFVSIAVE